MARAFEDLFSVPNAFQHIEMPGRTDSWILSDAVAAHGTPWAAADRTRFREVYLEHLRREIELPGARKGVMPGVRPLLDLLGRRDDVYLALLTGNYEEAARIKLEYFDLWRYFRCGAFGDDAPDRNGLLPKAMAAIRECGGPEVAPDRNRGHRRHAARRRMRRRLGGAIACRRDRRLRRRRLARRRRRRRHAGSDDTLEVLRTPGARGRPDSKDARMPSLTCER